MSSAEIKISLFRKLDSLEGEKLKKAYGLLLNYINTNNDIDEWEELSSDERDALKKGIKQLDNGEGRSHKDVMSNLRNRI